MDIGKFCLDRSFRREIFETYDSARTFFFFYIALVVLNL